MPDLLRGRPFTLEVLDARVRAPDGSDVIVAAHVRARATVVRHPWRFTIDDAVVTQGRWRLADGGPPGSSFIDAFRTVPAGGSRAACREPAPRTHGDHRQHAFSGGGSLIVRDLLLDEVDAELDFAPWGLKLPRVRARGSLAVGLPGTGGILFDARDVRAPGGSLRIGRANERGMTRAAFDEVVISRVAAAAEQPTDIALTVAGARTGRSKLSGQARFTNVFRLPGVKRASRPPPGVEMNARWTDMADMLARLEAAWLPKGATLEQVGLGGVLTARLSGPFKALTGAVMAEGGRAHLEATLDEGRRAALDVRADDLDLAPLLDARLHPLLDGSASGRLRAHVALAPRLADMDASIDEADVAIDRVAKAAGPRRFTFRVGPPARGTRAVPVSTADTLAVVLDRAHLHGATLGLDGWHVRWAGLSVGGQLDLSLPQPAADNLVDPPGRVDATLAATVTSLARWIPPEKIDARGTITAHVTGPFEHLRARVGFGQNSGVAIIGERFLAPREVSATLEGRTLTTTDMRFEHEGGGEFSARLHSVLGRDLGGHVELRHYPLARVPSFREIKPPYMLGAPAGASLADVLEGTVDGTLDGRGTLQRPVAAGTVALTGVRLAGRTVPDGRFTVHLAPLHGKVAGNLGPTLSIEGEADARRNGVAANADLTFNDFAVSPWLRSHKR